MTYTEKNAWAYLFIAIIGYGTYLWLVLSNASGGPLTDVDYVPLMLWTIGGAIVAGIVAGIALGIASPRNVEKPDRRDKEIERFGDHIGQAFYVAGLLGALALAIFEGDYFWIANVIYLAFVLAAVVGSIARLIAYRRGFQW